VAQLTRIEGEMIGLAPGRKLSGGEREFVLADKKKVYLYRQGTGLTKSAEYLLKGEGAILSLDSADIDRDGQLEVYVTVMDQEVLVSQVLAVTDQGFSVLADRLPYYFRAIALNGGERSVVAQEIGKEKEDFYGPVRRVVKKGSSFTTGEAIKLPKQVNLYSFNQFTAADGKRQYIIFDADGNLRILSEAGEELWKGSDRYGGSEVYFKRDEQQMQNLAMDRYRWRFLEQRIEVTAAEELIVPRNSGFMDFGNSRAYSKNSLFGFVWNGASLDERWHTKESPNYLADFFFDAERKELVLLEQVKKDKLFGKGASTITTKKIE
jgi:hypothetical protein